MVSLHGRLDEIHNHLGDRTLSMHEGVLAIRVNEVVVSPVCAEPRIRYSWGWQDGTAVQDSTALAEDPSLVPSTQSDESQMPVTPASGDPMPLGSVGPCIRVHVLSQTRIVKNIKYKGMTFALLFLGDRRMLTSCPGLLLL